MLKNEPKIEYRVIYEQNVDYEGEYQTPIYPGVQGTFRLKHDAEAAAKKCKDWFNQEKSVVKTVGKDGKVEETPHIELHDNVTVTIEKYVDGALCEEESCEEKPKKGKKDLVA